MTAAGDLIADRYRVSSPLAAGGMGHLWLGTDERTGNTVALKRSDVPKRLTAQERALARVWLPRESRAFARIRHPNVIRTLDVLLDGDAFWVIMEYVPSRSLRDVISDEGPLPPARVAAIGLDLLAALEAAAEADVLHLDVKPSNVLIADDGRVVLTDFGPAGTKAGLAALAEVGLVFGSPRYVAPERLYDGVSDERSDLWSLGATLYHVVEGRTPFGRDSIDETLMAAGLGRPDIPELAGPLTPVLLGLMRRDPAARMTAAEVRTRLRRIAPGRRAGAVRAGTAIGVAVAVVAFGGIAFAAQRSNTDRTVSESVAAPAFSSPVATPSGPPSAGVPAGYVWWIDPRGRFRVAAPTGWHRTRTARGLTGSGPAGSPVLTVAPWAAAPEGPVSALIAAETQIRLPGYHRIRIDRTTTPAGAVWEYTFQDTRTGTIRALRQIVTIGGHSYTIDWHTPSTTWAAALPTLLTILPTVSPSPGD